MQYGVGLLLLVWLFPVHAEISAQVIALNCLNCHLSDSAASKGAIPTFQYLSAAELRQLLLDFKYDRKPATLMPRIAKGYSDTELSAVADYLSPH